MSFVNDFPNFISFYVIQTCDNHELFQILILRSNFFLKDFNLLKKYVKQMDKSFDRKILIY